MDLDRDGSKESEHKLDDFVNDKSAGLWLGTMGRGEVWEGLWDSWECFN